MTLKEALEDVIAHPLKRALRTAHGTLYYDPSYGNDCFRIEQPGPMVVEQEPIKVSGPPMHWSAVGFGIHMFTVAEVVSDSHVVVDVDFKQFKVGFVFDRESHGF